MHSDLGFATHQRIGFTDFAPAQADTFVVLMTMRNRKDLSSMTAEEREKATSRVLTAIEAMRAGRMVIMVDDEDRENEGDLVLAASHVTPEKINFMAKEARGLICLTLDPQMVERLKLPMMTDHFKAGSTRSTAFTVSIEAREGVSTGISAADRAHTIRVATADDCKPEDIVVPGHIFPLKAKSGGVLERSGHTEGSVDLARLAGMKPAAVICEIMKDDGTMARVPDLEEFGKRFSIPIVSIADLIEYRLLRDGLVERIDDRPVHTATGTWRGVLYKSLVDQTTHFALVKGKDFGEQPVDVRVHRQRPLVDVFAHPESGGRSLINYGLELLRTSDAAVVLYLTQDHASMTPLSALTVDMHDLAATPGESERKTRIVGQTMDNRLYGIGAQILRDLGIRKMVTHVSTPRALKGLAGFGLEVTDMIVIDDQDHKSTESRDAKRSHASVPTTPLTKNEGTQSCPAAT